MLNEDVDSMVSEQNRRIKAYLDDFGDFLCKKNIAYGGQALSPRRIVSTADAIAGIEIRIDDKLSRLVDGHAAGEDVFADLIGYFVLREVALRYKAETDAKKSL